MTCYFLECDRLSITYASLSPITSQTASRNDPNRLDSVCLNRNDIRRLNGEQNFVRRVTVVLSELFSQCIGYLHTRRDYPVISPELVFVAALRQKKWHKNKSRDGNSNDESKRELFHGDLT